MSYKITETEGDKIICPYCHADNTEDWGKRFDGLGLSDEAIFECSKCGRQIRTVLELYPHFWTEPYPEAKERQDKIEFELFRQHAINVLNQLPKHEEKKYD